jgi:hypothetical protein
MIKNPEGHANIQLKIGRVKFLPFLWKKHFENVFGI